jgi:hypothetical protein
MIKSTRTLFSAVSMAVIAACGGGDSSQNTPPDSTTSPSQNSSIINTIQTSTYTTNSEELAAFNRLNAERRHCGFGTLRQDIRLDQAARAHADWMLINNIYAHIESSAYSNGFTGANSWDRASFAGYPSTYYTSELIAFGSTGTIAGRGDKGMREFFAGDYHANGALPPMNDVGISVRAPSDVGSDTVIVPTELVLGTTDGYQLPGVTDVLTYPCEGVTGTEYQLDDEEPNPVPERNLGGSPLGHPIIVMARMGQTLTISAAAMNRVRDNQSVSLRPPVTGAADPNNHLAYEPHFGYVLPDFPLEPLTSYRVTISGTNNGMSFTKNFIFTTGAG